MTSPNAISVKNTVRLSWMKTSVNQRLSGQRVTCWLANSVQRCLSRQLTTRNASWFLRNDDSHDDRLGVICMQPAKSLAMLKYASLFTCPRLCEQVLGLCGRGAQSRQRFTVFLRTVRSPSDATYRISGTCLAFKILGSMTTGRLPDTIRILRTRNLRTSRWLPSWQHSPNILLLHTACYNT